MPGLIRVGHKGADHVAPGNTEASFEAALDLGVDMIEFDVMPLRDGTLVLAHDPEDATSRTPLTLEQGLDHFAADAYANVELDVDLKYPAYAAVAWWRAGLPAKAERALRRGHCEALMSHYVLVTRQLVKRIKAAGGELYVWTVDDAAQIARLEALGVDAVITNDPRLFD